MRDVDVDILREMLRDRVLFWGGLDPRLSSDLIASRIGASGSTVRTRLRAWSDRGFLGVHATLPNPRLLGLGLATGNLRVPSPQDKPRVARDLALLEGTVTTLDHVGEWLVTNFAYASESALERRLESFRNVEGVAEALPCVPLRLPQPTLRPTALDWRLIEALRAMPERPVGDIAEEVGISARTFTRRHQRLVEGRALWFAPELDFGRWESGVIALLNIFPRDERDVAAVAGATRAALPGLLSLTASTDVLPEGRHPAVAALVHVPSVGDAEDALCEAARHPLVDDAELLFPRAVRVFTTWSEAPLRAARASASA